MAIDATDLYHNLVVRELGDVGVAFDALALSVHAAQETVCQHLRGTARFGLEGRLESFLAMAAKAGFIFERRVDLIGGGVLRPRDRCPKTGNGDEKKQAGENPRRASYNARPKAQIPGFQIPGFDVFERVVHDVPIPADRSQAPHWCSAKRDKLIARH
jgi:hypothetical protein